MRINWKRWLLVGLGYSLFGGICMTVISYLFVGEAAFIGTPWFIVAFALFWIGITLQEVE